MLIDRTTKEDLSMLDLLISKLEESMNLKGIKFFEYEKNETDIGDLWIHKEKHGNRALWDDEITKKTRHHATKTS